MKKSLIDELRIIFVPLEVFNLRVSPIEKIVYGAVSLILISVVTAIIYVVIRK